MQIKYSGNLEADMLRLVNETYKLYKNFQHIERAMTLPLGVIFKRDEFAKIFTLLAADKLRRYKR